MRIRKLKNILVQFEPKHLGYLVLVSSFTIGVGTYAYTISQGGGPYQTADWLINYSGGFVRRGLFGEILLFINPKFSLLLKELFFIQMLLYGFVYLFFAFLLHKNKSSWFATAFICSPAGIAFYGWDPYAFGRKEVLFYLSIIFLALAFKHRITNRRKSLMFFICGIFFYIFGIFCWEVVFLGSVGILYLSRIIILSHFESVLKCRLIQSAIFTTSLFSFYLNIVNSGNSQKSKQICSSLKDSGLKETNFCEGAISALGWNLKYTLDLVKNSFPLYLRYIPLLVISFGLFFLLKMRFKTYVILSLNSLALIPLFLIVNDYGRWISIIFTSNLIMMITLEENIFYNTRWSISVAKQTQKVVSAIYMLAWGIPHYADPDKSFPNISGFSSIIKFLKQIFFYLKY